MRMLADGALLLELSNADALDLAAALTVAPPPGFLDAVPGARTLLVLFDPARFDPSSLDAVRKSAPRPPPRTVRLRAVYDGEDLPAIAAQTGLAIPELVRLHTQAVHTVAFLGFAPGFAYLTGAPLPLAVPRLKTPRLRVPAGSVAVADGYSAVYPLESPGGWRLIGRVAERMFEVDASPPALLRPGDRVVFEAVDQLPAMSAPIKLPPQGEPVLKAIAPGPLTTVQGGPRYGLCASGVPAGGAMDLPALAAVNALLGNAPDAAGLEFTIAGPELEALADVRVAANGAVRDLRTGDRIKIGMLKDGARGYVAVEGGLARPRPGEPTRALLKGDELTRPPASGWPVGPRPEAAGPRPDEAVGPRPAFTAGVLHVRALPGPQFDHFPAPERFFAAEYTLSPQSDRRGLRLKGPQLSPLRADIPPEGTAPGAVQVPGDGLPIVLGPDRPVTGGYPKIATVISADLPLLAQARPGARIRFLQVDLAEALGAREEGAHKTPGARGGQP
jgi:KipI family sensor histidine kinase inhibitor